MLLQHHTFGTAVALATTLTIALALAHLAQAAEPVPIGPELLPNGSFEQIDPATQRPVEWKGFWVPDWGDCAGTLRTSTTAPRHGQRCIELSGVRVQYAAVHPRKLTLDPTKTYLLSAWVRTELARGEHACLVASWFGDRRWLSLARSRPVRGRKPWTRLTMLLKPEDRSKDTRTVQVSFRVYGESQRSKAWVDAMSLRECRVPPPPPWVQMERRRLLDMARELLVERQVWAERLATLRTRRADLARLVADARPFAQLVRQSGDAARRRAFLTQLPRPRTALEPAVPTDDVAVCAQVAAINELPTLRQQCFDELQAMLTLKRQLDAQPDRRRFYLWAQLAAMRSAPVRPDPAQHAPSPALRAALDTPPAEPTGELVDMVVRTRLDLAVDRGTVSIAAPPLGGKPQDTLTAGLFAPGGALVAGATATVGTEPTRLEFALDRPIRWFLDCPVLYTLRVVLVRGGRPADQVEQKVAFRDIRIVECDASPTLRHAWNWALTDYTHTINGQPVFPQGTVCGALKTDDLPQAVDLFGELWLDFQRTYGSSLSRLAGKWGDAFAAHGLTFTASLRPNYQRIRRYVSSRQGLEVYREMVRDNRAVASHPALLTLEIGNEAELSVWGADLQSVYGRDLWHVFNEVNRLVRAEMAPDVPVAYVRAAHFRSVAPVPRNDYDGVNQYTGRYWGRRATISSDLAAIAQAATLHNKPIAITEWNGPKYSWATSGVSGVDEDGAAQYIFDYFQRMTRTPAVVHSTEFVLNWVVTPLEDLTSMPLAEGLKRRSQWDWSLQKGTPWYPRIWPNLLTDTPARRVMRGFQSPIFTLCSAPGDIVVAADGRLKKETEHLAHRIRRLGRQAKVAALPSATALDSLDANLLLIGGLGADQPQAVRRLEDMGVVGRTTAAFPPPEGFLIQRRINPFFPDRSLVVVTAADRAGMRRALAKLAASAAGLEQAFARQATCRRALALIDDDRTTRDAFGRYVMELPTRSRFVGWDDLRSRLAPNELLAPDGKLRPHWADLGAVIVAARRKLDATERAQLAALPAYGVRVIWSAATLDANPDLAKSLGVRLGPAHPLTEHFPVARWARGPLAVPDLGDVAADRVEKFARLKRDSKQWPHAMTIREVAAQGYTAAATTAAGKPVVVFRAEGRGQHWVFGADLSAAAVTLWRTTHRGENHRIYDRDTACGLERLFRVVANAAAGHPPRPAATPRLRATIAADRETYGWGDTARIHVRVRDADGRPCDAAVRVGFTHVAGFGRPTTPQRWAQAKRIAQGLYAIEAPLAREPADDALIAATPPSRYHLQQRLVTVFADVARSGWVSDWTSDVVRVTPDTQETAHLAEMARRVAGNLAVAKLNINEKETWIELTAELELPTAIQAGTPARLVLSVLKIEHDTGGDWMEDTELVLRSPDGKREVRLPVAPGRILASPRAPIVKQRPKDCQVVDSTHPARFELMWRKPTSGTWTVALAYRYSDDYHKDDTFRRPRLDAFPNVTLDVVEKRQ